MNASIETIKTIRNDSKKRPLFTNKNALEKYFLNERKQYYHQCSDIVIDTDNKEPKTIAKEIIKKADL